MADDSNETIVINDLLCLLSCKHTLHSSDHLIKVIRGYFTEHVIIDACETLQESILEPLADAIRKPKSLPKAIEAIITYMQFTPKEELPIFVCKNLNTLPKLVYSTKEAKNRQKRSYEKRMILKEEYSLMKAKIAEITAIIFQLRDQLQDMASKHSRTMPERKQIRDNAENRRLSEVENGPKTGLAYLQQLIDEEDRRNDLRPPAKKYLKDEENEEDIDDPPQFDVCEYNNPEEEEEVCGAFIDTKAIRKHSRKLSPPKLQKSALKFSEERADRIPRFERASEETHDKDFEVCPSTGLIKICVGDFVEDSFFNDNIETEDDETEEKQADVWKSTASSKKTLLERSIFICPFCKFKSECRETLQKHLESHSESNITPLDDEDDHSSVIKSEENSHQCLLCLQEFSQKSLLEEHVNRCPTMSFDNENLFVEPEEKHACPVCKVIFSSKFSLISHKGYHDKARAFHCSICDYRFYTQENLESHYKVHTDGIYKCPYCEYGNALKKRVISHIHCHTGYKPFRCTLCDYRSASNNALERHILTHSEKRSFHCTECKASFKTKDKLSSHKRLHLKGKPYKCPVCGKGFKVPTAMKVHYRTHTDYKPHACPVCPYRARTAAVLRIHSNIHSTEKPFKCHVCDFKANQKSYLSWHIRAYHPKA